MYAEVLEVVARGRNIEAWFLDTHEECCGSGCEDKQEEFPVGNKLYCRKWD